MLKLSISYHTQISIRDFNGANNVPRLTTNKYPSMNTLNTDMNLNHGLCFPRVQNTLFPDLNFVVRISQNGSQGGGGQGLDM